MKSQIKIGTRGSKLALYQAEHVKAKILQSYPQIDVEIVIIKTSGDEGQHGEFNPLETKRVFTREIEDALIKGEVDVAVHSAKDMAAVSPEGTKIGAVMKREDARDCFIGRDQKTLKDLGEGAKIGTSAIRRRKELLRAYPEVKVEEIRGNVDTRIAKVQNGEVDGIILALAGVKRLGLTNHVSEVLPIETFLPAPGQGIIAVQIREDDQEVADILKLTHDERSGIQLECERAFLQRLEGSCQLPCGMVTMFGQTTLKLSGILFDVDSDQVIEAHLEGSIEDPQGLGKDLAESILANGGTQILEKIKKD